MATEKEKKAAFDAAKNMIMEHVPAIFRRRIEDKMVSEVVDAVLNAAETVRNNEKKT